MKLKITFGQSVFADHFSGHPAWDAVVTFRKANDGFGIKDNKVTPLSNNNGGINGGISNGAPITIGVAIKPTPSISKEQNTIDLVSRKNTKIKIAGRHDSCIAIRAVPCIESAIAIAITDEIIGEL